MKKISVCSLVSWLHVRKRNTLTFKLLFLSGATLPESLSASVTTASSLLDPKTRLKLQQEDNWLCARQDWWETNEGCDTDQENAKNTANQVNEWIKEDYLPRKNRDIDEYIKWDKGICVHALKWWDWREESFIFGFWCYRTVQRINI